MFVLIWVTLLFPARGSNAGPALPTEESTTCVDKVCLTLPEGNITAEAGLCVVIPCSVNKNYPFMLRDMQWNKCHPMKYGCFDSEIIFHSGKSKRRRERVSLLEPDLSRGNCGIIINDLTESDSGSYQLRIFIYSRSENKNRLAFSSRANVSVKDLIQKPAVIIPSLTAGQQTTLICTAPGLCSGSDPKITWTWRGRGESDSHITGNTTRSSRLSLSTFQQRRSSTLTFNLSAEHHNTNVTCKVSFTNNITTEETVTLAVKSPPKILNNSGCEVQSKVLTCVCVTEGFPEPVIRWPLLRNEIEYSLITTLSKHTVNSTIILSVKDHSNTVKCVSTNEVGQVQKDIDIDMILSSGMKEAAQRGSTVMLPWAIAAVSLIVNVICIICVIFLWNTRKKVKPYQEDRTYMTLEKTGPSQEYDVIGQPVS